MRDALHEILGREFNVTALLADPDVSLEMVVATALIAVDAHKLDTQAARELVAWDERRRAAEAASVH